MGNERELSMFEQVNLGILAALLLFCARTWDDTKFAFKHYTDIERIAMVGDRRWEKWMAQVCRPFTKATVRYFDVSQVNDAWAWLREEKEAPVGS